MLRAVWKFTKNSRLKQIFLNVALFYLNLFHSSHTCWGCCLIKQNLKEVSILWAKKPSLLLQSVAVQGVTYLAKWKQIPMQCFSPADRAANKPALKNITNVLLITRSSISNSVGLEGVCSVVAPLLSSPLAPQGSEHCHIIPGFALIYTIGAKHLYWRFSSYLKSIKLSNFTEIAHTKNWSNIVMN